jgi:hypothetical protein
MLALLGGGLRAFWGCAVEGRKQATIRAVGLGEYQERPVENRQRIKTW